MKREVSRGRYQPGALLPSVRSLASELTINPNTVMRAYQLMEAQGIIITRRGKGIFLSAKAPAICRREIGAANLEQLEELITHLATNGLSEAEINMAVKRALKNVKKKGRGAVNERRIG